MPHPLKNEQRKEFISRCIGDSKMNKEFPNQKQRIAVCYSYADKYYDKDVKEHLTFKQFLETIPSS